MVRVCLQPKHRVSVATPVLCLAQNRLFKTFLHIRVQDLKQDVLCVAFLPPKTSGDIKLLPNILFGCEHGFRAVQAHHETWAIYSFRRRPWRKWKLCADIKRMSM